ncbi:MAG: topoisomerase DNA-binding C4 zinc finger domain-containing protein [Candidatus Accumulibacter sp.]|nr:topoisomerase DNA-binding C4 zinc finger domain-containing protein [Accumulibacter sp.]
MARLQGASPVMGKTVTFEAKGRTLIDPGWLKLLAGDQTQEDEDAGEAANPVPLLEADQRLDALRGKLLEKKTQPPARFTEASLVKKLESEGIGRPATYAAIMNNIVTRAYVRVEKKYLVPTATGELIVDSLVGKFTFIDLGFTRGVEQDLDRIEQGQAAYIDVISKVYDRLKSELATIEIASAPKHPCPECGKALRRVKGKSGFFWGCSGYPDCSVTLPDDDGQPGQRKPQEVSLFVCKKCGKALIHRTKPGKGGYDFWGCSGFRDGCKATYENKNDKPCFDKAK